MGYVAYAMVMVKGASKDGRVSDGNRLALEFSIEDNDSVLYLADSGRRFWKRSGRMHLYGKTRQ